jgi:hypothetical protein
VHLLKDLHLWSLNRDEHLAWEMDEVDRMLRGWLESPRPAMKRSKRLFERLATLHAI